MPAVGAQRVALAGVLSTSPVCVGYPTPPPCFEQAMWVILRRVCKQVENLPQAGPGGALRYPMALSGTEESSATLTQT